ncbi:MAG TPA: acetolactate synthase [Actinomycetota bacterium]|nr:acetolactate synthase [Actinomycetota bacterium]
MEANGGHQAAAALRAHGVDVVYTLSGGHIFPLYDGCVQREIRLLDVRHEQTATFAAEGHAKLTRGIGVAAVTAGPGVTNAISPITSAHFNGSPVLVLGGRAPQGRWGSGSLQEMDHLPLVRSITKRAETVFDPAAAAGAVHDAVTEALTPHRGPVFLDFPLDSFFLPAEPSGEAQGHAWRELLEDGGVRLSREVRAPAPGSDQVLAAARLLSDAERPVLVGGSDVWWDGAWQALANLAQELRIPVVLNGMGRGCMPADHELVFSRARSVAFREADLVVVVGTPLDFRLGFGHFGRARVVHIQDSPSVLGGHASPAASVAGDLNSALTAIADAATRRSDPEAWIEKLRGAEQTKRAGERDELEGDSHPIHPARVYGILSSKLDRDAVVICDGGDFVSYAGKLVESYTPGCWLDPGPYGCLGTGLGYAAAARIVHPDRQVVLLLGDGAFGFSGLDFDTLVRHRLPVVAIVGNNGIWGLEKHPMQMLYGYDVAADLRQETAYDAVVKALGGAGETVEKASELPDALDRAFESGVPYLINVLTDPSVAYPRSSNLA